ANNNLTGEALSGYGGGANHSYSTVLSGQPNPDGYDENDDRIRWNQSAISRTIELVRSNIGNIITYTENTTSSGRSYNAAHALTQIFAKTQVYDTDGNLTSDGNPTPANSTTLVWDEANRLKQVNYPNGDTDQFGYDALGRRAWKSHKPSGQSATTSVYIYVGNNCIAEYANGTLINEYVYAGGIDSLVMISRSNDTQRYGVLRSARWNVLALHDLVTHSNGIVERYSYDIFGARSIWAANGTTSRAVSSYGMEIGNTSCRHDKKFIYMRNRYYDPVSGEFISRDPMGFVDGSSLYRGYFQASGVDPLGLDVTSGSTSNGLNYLSVSEDGMFWGLFGNTPLGTVVYNPLEVSEETARHIAEQKLSEGTEFGVFYLGNASRADLSFNDTGLGRLIRAISQGKGGFQGELGKNLDTGLAYRRELGLLAPADRFAVNEDAYNRLKEIPWLGSFTRITYGELIEPGATGAGAKVLVYEATETVALGNLAKVMTVASSLRNSRRVVQTVDDVPISGASRKLFNSLEGFKAGTGLVFKSDKEAAKAFEVYKNAGKSQKGIVIGHGLDPINHGHSGWQAFRMKGADWTDEINMAWIDGAVDAGKPVLLATPYKDIIVGSVTWREMVRVINRGGKVVFER
ncbi:MAG: hypothetical protein Q8M16_03720, partial [Pirellulaceae bacterium]|nr:hypothetical protein [Pirellulaceae bacterium]